ncbi:TPM domain-containing protein [Rhodocaloribacter litoris]|uniref:TPM domain-containing protein n=1 Tax=Rhodocaloribacter litoris TaxID=2558931 RepID=UPI001E5B96ED|nr:TPM domain-containing protein [Rhodocaloribacter litoris]
MRWLPIVIGGLLALAAPAAAQRIEVLPPSGRWVTDNADLLSPAEERILSARLAGYADTTSTQIIIVTLPSLGGVPAADYAVELGRRWGVGQQGKDNGIVILVSRDDREVFIATGFGLEGAIPDAVAARIVRNIIIPHFRQGRFYDGLSAAVDALIQAAAGTFTAEPVPRSAPGDTPNYALLFILLILAVFILSSLGNRGGGRGGGRRYRHRHGGPPVIIWGGGWGDYGGRHGGFGGLGGGGFGGFGGGGGGFGGGGAGGSW